MKRIKSWQIITKTGESIDKKWRKLAKKNKLILKLQVYLQLRALILKVNLI